MNKRWILPARLVLVGIVWAGLAVKLLGDPSDPEAISGWILLALWLYVLTDQDTCTKV